MTQTVTTKNVALSAHSKRLLNRVTEHLETFFRSVLRVEWVLDTYSHGVEVHLHVHARSGHYRARCRADQVSEAIRQAADKVERQRRRRKEIDLRKKRRTKPFLGAVGDNQQENESLELGSPRWEA